MPGDVDIVIASELMEAGRAMQRGLVTPDRTTFIVSTNRVYSMTERIALADGRVDSDALLEGCRAAAKRLIHGDMAQLAEATGSVISAVLFGALAGAEALPIAAHGVRGGDPARRRRRQGEHRGVRRGLCGGRRRAGSARSRPSRAAPAARRRRALAPTDGRGRCATPEPARTFVRAGIERLADYQDVGLCARTISTASKPIAEIDKRHGDGSGACWPRPRASLRSAWPTRTPSASPS